MSSDSDDNIPKPRHGLRADRFQEDEASDSEATSDDDFSEEEELMDQEKFVVDDENIEEEKNMRSIYRNRDRERERLMIQQATERFKNQDYYEREVYEVTTDENASTPIAQWRLSLTPKDSKRLYIVHVKPSKELFCVYFLMKKYFRHASEASGRLVSEYPTVYSSFFTIKGSGIIFVEAITPREVLQIRYNLPNIQAKPLTTVPVKDMTGCMLPSTERNVIEPGMFVRIRREMKKGESFQNDLAQVVSFNPNNNEVLVKLIPRIDYPGLEEYRNSEIAGQTDLTKEKVKKAKTYRPPQDDFNYERLSKIVEVASNEKFFKKFKGIPQAAKEEIQSNKLYKWDHSYFYHTFAYKIYPVDRIITHNLNIGSDEPTKFINGLSSTLFEKKIPHFEDNMYSSLHLTSQTTFSANDLAIVRDGEYSGLVVTIMSVINDNEVEVSPIDKSIFEGIFTIGREHLMKYFKPGDHVSIISGQYMKQTGEVLEVSNNIATISLDTQQRAIEVPTLYLSMTHEINQGETSIGKYRLFDFVLLSDNQTRGVIWRIENQSIYVLMTNGQSKTTGLDGIASKQRDARGSDAQGREIIVGQTVVVENNQYKQIRAQVKHISHDGVFLHNDSITQHNGLFVAASNECQGGASTSSNRSNNSMHFTVGRSSQKSDLIGKTIIITSGPLKNQLATIKEADQLTIKVLMHNTSKKMSFYINAQETQDKPMRHGDNQKLQNTWKLVETNNSSDRDPFNRLFGRRSKSNSHSQDNYGNSYGRHDNPVPQYGHDQNQSPYGNQYDRGY